MFPARYWREIPQRYRMEAGECTKCGKQFFPPRPVCDKCGSRSLETVRLPLTGKVISYTVQHSASADYSDLTPFAVGIVELDGGARLTAQLADIVDEEIRVGMPVRMEFRRLFSHGEHGLHCYGYKAVPVR